MAKISKQSIISAVHKYISKHQSQVPTTGTHLRKNAIHLWVSTYCLAQMNAFKDPLTSNLKLASLTNNELYNHNKNKYIENLTII